MQENNYLNLSKAFVHWFFEQYLKLDEQAIGENIIDGDSDNGVDGIVYNENSKELILYQFKFPASKKNLGKQIDETTVLKLINGYNKLTATRKPIKANENFLTYRNMIKEKDIFSYRFVFVAFQDSFSEHAYDALQTFIQEVQEESGNTIKYDIYDKKKTCDMYDQLQHSLRKDIKLKYSKLDTSFNLAGIANSYTGFASAKEVIEACREVMDTIFDENIRLFEGDNPVNLGIRNTALSDDSKFFNFFHNGIVFICDGYQNSTGNQVIELNSTSIVNGCQTINVLYKLYENNQLKDDLFLPIRIIITSDFELRSKITEYLNTQTEIRESYFLANNSFIRELQTDLLQKGYFLERLIKEYDYKRKLGIIGEFDKSRILPLEKTIQKYTGFSRNEYAARAKRGKGELFDRQTIDDIVCNMSSEAIIEADEIYSKISEVITLYRRCRRSGDNKPFFDFLKIDLGPEEQKGGIENYQFVNTADILLLNCVSNLKAKFKNLTVNEYIVKAIEICKNEIREFKGYPSGLTKNNAVFEQIQKVVSTI
jgi:hypothetical protein